MSPESVVERARAESTVVRSVQWSPALGARTLTIADFEPPDAFRMRVRHGYSNGFTRVLRARVRPSATGSRIEVTFHSIAWVEILMRLVAVALLLPLGAVADDLAALPRAASGAAVTIVVLIAIEFVGRRLGDRDERILRDALRSWFA